MLKQSVAAGQQRMKKIHITVAAVLVCCQVICVQSAYPSKKHHTSNNINIGERFMMVLDRINSRVEKAMSNGGIDVLTSQNIMAMLDRVNTRVEQAVQNGGITVSQTQSILDLINSIRERVQLHPAVPDKEGYSGKKEVNIADRIRYGRDNIKEWPADNMAGNSDADSPIENKQDNMTSKEHPQQDKMTTQEHPQQDNMTTQEHPQHDNMTTQEHPQQDNMTTQEHPQQDNMTTQEHPQHDNMTTQEHPQQDNMTTQEHPQPDKMTTLEHPQ